MTTLTVEHIDVTPGGRAARVLDVTARLAEDELAGRTIWSASALPGGRASARMFSGQLREPGDLDVAVRPLDVGADEDLMRLAQRVERMLTDATATPGQLGPAEDDVYVQGAQSGEGLVGDRVRPDDVVVLHDALTAALAQAIRERGAHVVWHVPAGAQSPSEAWDFLRRHTAALDAYLTAREGLMAALMPSPDAVAAMEVPMGGRYDTVAWGCLLADVVHDDRHEHVGGRRHARPDVAPR
jgi:hypothetical protein